MLAMVQIHRSRGLINRYRGAASDVTRVYILAEPGCLQHSERIDRYPSTASRQSSGHRDHDAAVGTYSEVALRMRLKYEQEVDYGH